MASTITILWTEPVPLTVNVTNGGNAVTGATIQGGGGATFPLLITQTTTLILADSADVVVSTTLNGVEIASASGQSRSVHVGKNSSLVFAPSRKVDANANVQYLGASAPTAAAGAQNGGAPPAPVVAAGSSTTRGAITFGSGTTPAAGAQCVVTYVPAIAAAGAVVLIPKNSATQALGCFVSATSTGGFTLSTASAPTASQANTVYSFEYVVIS